MTAPATETPKVEPKAPARAKPDLPLGRRMFGYLFLMVVLGVLVGNSAFRELVDAPFNYLFPLLAFATLVASRIAVRLPGRSASIDVSDVFVFSAILVLGPAHATAIVIIDGLLRAVLDRTQPLHRIPLNIAEPAVATFIAGQTYLYSVTLVPSLIAYSPLVTWLPAAAMTATYFAAHSVCLALTQSLETGTRPFVVWKQQALLLIVKHYTAASVAVLTGVSGQTFNPVVFAMMVPLLALSYIAYREASARVEAANKHVKDVERLYRATVETLAVAVDAKDQVTHGHIRRVQRHAMAVARALDVVDPIELKALESAALLHDVGKLAMPDYVLNKPGTLTHGEYETMKLHATKGATILTAVEFPYPVVPTVRHHHEWWNGRGYPDGLAGEDIPLGARILAVVDCFDALTSDRPYRRRLKDDDAVQMLRDRSGTIYDPRIVDGFIKLLPSLRKEDARTGDVPSVEKVAPAAALGVDPMSEPVLSSSQNQELAALRVAAAETMDKAGKLFPGDEVCLYAISQSGDTIVRAIATPALERVLGDRSFPIGQGLSGWVAANRHSIVNSDAGLDLGDQADSVNLRTAASTPVFAFGNVIGVLTVYSSERGAYSLHHARIIGVLAQEIGQAMVQHQAQQYRQQSGARRAASAPFSSVSASHRTSV